MNTELAEQRSNRSRRQRVGVRVGFAVEPVAQVSAGFPAQIHRSRAGADHAQSVCRQAGASRPGATLSPPAARIGHRAGRSHRFAAGRLGRSRGLPKACSLPTTRKKPMPATKCVQLARPLTSGNSHPTNRGHWRWKPLCPVRWWIRSAAKIWGCRWWASSIWYLPEQAGPLIADFKTAASSKPPPEIQHEIQLSCYSYLFRQRLRPAGNGPGDPLAGQDQDAADRVSSLCRPAGSALCADCSRSCGRTWRISSAAEFLYRPGWTCAMCDYRDGPCRSGEEDKRRATCLRRP